MGHSQGGDISMLFAQLHPERMEHVISLDNRRMPLPRTREPLVCSIRSSDQVADEGVLPTPREAREHGMRIVPCSVPHNAMNDHAAPEQHRELTGLVLEMLRGTAPVMAPR
jgi:pimeloyl-ACP methyl ester carboxylesterase